MGELFETIYSNYGHVARYPRRAKLTGFEWSLECDLDDTFSFLLERPGTTELLRLNDDEFMAFLAGIFDAEGTVHLHKKVKWYNPEVLVTNTDAKLLELIRNRLRQLGFHCSLRWRQQREDRNGIKGQSMLGRVEVLRFEEAQRILTMMPIRHREKLARKVLALRLEFPSTSFDENNVACSWRALSARIGMERKQFIEDARRAHTDKLPIHSSQNGI